EEFLLSEKLRTTILVCVFFAAMTLTATNLLLFRNTGTDELNKDSLHFILFFQSGLFTFELLSLLYIKRKICRKELHIPVFGQYLNALIEISAPVMVMLSLSHQYQTPVMILHSPVVYAYFLFIILSTLRLNFKITFVTGLFAGISFLLVSLYFLQNAGSSYTVRTNDYVSCISKSMVIFISGIGAAFVAKQIRTSIDRSLAAAEAGNKIVNLFGQQISKEIVEEMIESEGTVQSRLMNVCVMFVDIRNFTKHVAGKLPGEIVQYQNAFFEIIINAVTNHHGIINQFLGDGCMITFGAPVALQNPSQHAVWAALEIQNNLTEQIEKGNIPYTNIGIGIHTGDAVTGNIGTKERQQYSITGSVVILAARIEQLNKEFHSQILISEDVKRHVNGSLPAGTAFLGNAELKGWHQPIGIYKVA
ncbi:MAG TPA: adenylate/guanylate cyclase domain-containing protein, partial [Chitinophagaceae bacterium]|nr:adenylate/guanylate cyclase domain-containing protein [Chitinophagaceae bacterium]